MLHLVIEIDAETNDMQWLGLPYCSHPNIDYCDVFAISCLYQVLSCDSLADMSYIADKKEKCPGFFFFFLVAILYTTCRIDKLLFSHLKKMNSIWQQTKCIVSKIMPCFYFCFNCRVKRNKVRRSNIKFN